MIGNGIETILPKNRIWTSQSKRNNIDVQAVSTPHHTDNLPVPRIQKRRYSKPFIPYQGGKESSQTTAFRTAKNKPSLTIS